jgi:hypothetical protein
VRIVRCQSIRQRPSENRIHFGMTYVHVMVPLFFRGRFLIGINSWHRSEAHRLMPSSFPQSTHATESWNAAFRADSCTGKNEDTVGKTVSMGRNAKLNQQRPLGATIAEQNFRNWFQMHKTVNIPLCGLKRGSAG